MWKWTPIIVLSGAIALAGCSRTEDGRDGNTDVGDQPGYAQQAPEAAGPDESANKMPTPMDQGQGEVDLGITQRVRQQLIADGSLSVEAKNVMVITLDKAVALRGPVVSDAEKTRIGQIAETTPDVIRVFNLLDVRPPEAK